MEPQVKPCYETVENTVKYDSKAYTTIAHETVPVPNTGDAIENTLVALRDAIREIEALRKTHYAFSTAVDNALYPDGQNRIAIRDSVNDAAQLAMLEIVRKAAYKADMEVSNVLTYRYR